MVVPPGGIEPPSLVPKTSTLSVKLRRQQNFYYYSGFDTLRLMVNIGEFLAKSLVAHLNILPGSMAKKTSLNGFKPFITISREPGSGGRPIAEAVAKELGFELYDEKFVEEISKSAKRRTDLIKSIDEKSRSLVADILQSVLNPDYISDMTYMRHVAKVVLSRAHRGKVIFLDRGANFIVPSGSALRVRIQAPYPARVARAIKYENIDLEQAKETIRAHDQERKDFVRQYFGKNISTANYYDLVINTMHMTMEDAKDIIILAYKKKFRIK